MNDEDDTISAICTGVGGAVTIVRISGKEALNIGNKIWKSGKSLHYKNKRIMHFGKILPDDKGVGEPALAVYMPEPKSYTGEDIVEIHAHGGAFNAKRLLDEVVARGARLAGPGEFTFRAFMNGKLDLTQAEAVSDIITANSNMALHLAERQMDGILGRKIRGIREQIIEILVECESRVDFPEEELDFIPVDKQIEILNQLKNDVHELYSTRSEGAVLRDGIRVVIAGRPNAGKSSLLNLLLGYDRAITTDIPGTTRDTLEEFANIRGIPVILIDTAGLRKSNDQIESIGIERTITSLKRSEVTIWILDSSSDDLEKEIREMEKHIRGLKNVIAVWNKTDLCSKSDELVEFLLPTAQISIKKKDGIEKFLNLFERIVWEHPHMNEPEIAVSVRHAELLAKALELFPDIITTLSDNDWELAALGLKGVVSFLGEIIGEEANLDIYETIFSKFCIGK